MLVSKLRLKVGKSVLIIQGVSESMDMFSSGDGKQKLFKVVVDTV